MIPAHPTVTPPQSGEATTLYRNPAAGAAKPGKVSFQMNSKIT